MNKKVSLVIIPKPNLELKQGTYVLGKDGKLSFANHELINNPELRKDFTSVECYFVDDRPILPNNNFISYDNGPTLKTHTEIDHVLNKGKFKKGERRVYISSKDVLWCYKPDTKEKYPFGPWHLNEIIDKGFTCYVKERHNECNGETCLNCNCYEYDEEKFIPEKIDNGFVIVI